MDWLELSWEKFLLDDNSLKEFYINFKKDLKEIRDIRNIDSKKSRPASKQNIVESTDLAKAFLKSDSNGLSSTDISKIVKSYIVEGEILNAESQMALAEVDLCEEIGSFSLDSEVIIAKIYDNYQFVSSTFI